LRPFLSLGPTPLANAFLDAPGDFAAECSYPLDVYFCTACALVQLVDVIDPEVLFREYIYVTGTSDTIAAHNLGYAQTVAERLRLQPGDLVVEIASNDGSLLRCFQPFGVRALGIEPASNIAAMARAVGVETVNEFFNSSTAETIRSTYGRAKAVMFNNVLAHVDQTQDFLRGCRALLHDDGLAIFEVPSLARLVERLEYDTIYHEHLCYFSVHALARLCESVGLSVVAVEDVQVHGGSLRVYAGAKEQHGSHAGEVMRRVERERLAGLASLEPFERFAARVRDNRRVLLDLLMRLRSAGKTIAAYGAPAKGNTLLNYCHIDTDLVEFTVDKNLLKVGKYTPGMHLPVQRVSTLLERQPDYVLILAWNFADEIMSQQQEYRDRGGRFIVPIPAATII
jgi:hypothetical protein